MGRPDLADAPTVDESVLEILRTLADGGTTAEAAAASNLSEATVWRRLQALRQAWGVGHNIQVIVHAVRRGLI